MHTQSNFRLLVVRLGAMGDILHALPAVTALRIAHPSWQIGWVVEPHWRPLLAASVIRDRGAEISAKRGPNMPLVDRLHFAPTRQWKRHPLAGSTLSEIKALRSELRAAQYDAVLDLQGAIRSGGFILVACPGCKRRIGEASPREWPAQWFFTERVATRGAHVIDQDVELASAVAGDALTPAEPLIPVDDEAEAWCDALLANSSAGPLRPIALITPGAGWGAKRWPPERYAAVARGLAERGLRVLVNAGPGEESLAETITAGGSASALAASIFHNSSH